MKFIFVYAFSLFLVFPQLGWGESGDSTGRKLTEWLRPYRNSSGLKSEIRKLFYQEYKDGSDESFGQIYLFEGRLKIKIDEPKESESLLVVNKQSLWLETPFGEGFPPAVTKLPLKDLKKSEGIWSVLIGDGELSKSFLVQSEKDKNQTRFEMEPKKKDSYELTKVIIGFDKDITLKSLAYIDQLGNKVTYEFKDWKKEKMTVKDFSYSPPKDASVTEL